jgi:feruloyl-CoA synthase
MLMADPPLLEVGEITDKGSLNQQAILQWRSAMVEHLYAEGARDHVITID